MSDWTVSVISAGQEYNISDAVDFLLTGIDGIGHAPVVRITETGPMQHGARDLGYRLQPRRILLAFEAAGGDRAAWLARRDEVARIFRASNNALALRLTNDTWRRQIDCYLSGEMQATPDNTLGSVWTRFGVELLAPDPTWYDPAQASVALGGGGGTGTPVPTLIPMTVGASDLAETASILYAGSWDASPVVRIVGPVANPVVQNLTTGDKLDFTGTTVAAGDWYQVDTRYGRHSVVDAAGTNQIAALSSDSNLSTFRIAAHPTAPGGQNAIRATGTGISSATVVRLSYYTQFVGV